jgi:hypothetical protein
VFDKITPKYARLDLTSLQLRQVRLSMAEDAVRLNGLASGHIMLDFR